MAEEFDSVTSDVEPLTSAEVEVYEFWGELLAQCWLAERRGLTLEEARDELS